MAHRDSVDKLLFWTSLSRANKDRRRTRGRRAKPRAQLGLELLEDRRMLSNFVVTNTDDSGAGSLRAALSSGSTTSVTFAPYLSGQTIVLTSGQLVINQDVSITGLGANELAISGNDSSRVFDVAGGTNVQISGLTIENGLQVGGDPTVSNGSLTLNGGGGGILNDGTLTLTDCTISGNAAQGANGGSSYQGGGYGGGITNAGSLTIVGSVLSDNSAIGGAGQSTPYGSGAGGGGAGLGGAIINLTNSSLELIDSTISGDLAIGGAGGTAGRPVSNATYPGGNGGNHVGIKTSGYYSGYGGGVLGVAQSPAFGVGAGGGQEVPFGANNGGQGGFGGGGGGGSVGSHYTGYFGVGGNGGAYAGSGGTGQSTYRDLSGGGGGGGAGLGGGLFNDNGTITVTSSTIANNTATGGAGGVAANSSADGSPGQGVGGGVFNHGGTVTVLSTIIAQNNLIMGTNGTDVFGTFNDSGNNFIGTTSGSSGFGAATLTGNPLLGTLADNGGPTETMALITGSPCIGTGADSVLAAPYNLTSDQRGFARETDGQVDIGAYEHQVLAPPQIQILSITPQNSTFTGAVATFTELDGGEPAADFTATINWGDGTTSAGTITESNVGVYTVSGTHRYAPGAYTLSVTVDNLGNAFTSIASMPTAASGATAATGINGLIYVFGGANSSGEALNTVQAYDPATGAWTTEASLPTAAIGAVAVADPSTGLIYVIGGNTGSNLLTTVQAYNPVTNSWTTEAFMPEQREYAAAALASDGQIYVIGGFAGGGITGGAVESYNPATNSWTVDNNLKISVQGAVAVADSNGLIYLFGGENSGGTALSTVETIDTQNGAQSTAPSMPFASAFQAAAAGDDGQIYVFGGSNGTSNLNTVAAFNPATGVWTSEPSLPSGRSHLAGVEGPNGAVYAIGGLDSSGNASAEVDDDFPAGPSGTASAQLVWEAAPTINGSSLGSFTVGVAASFDVFATGVPIPTLTETGTLPAGVAFTDNGDGSATLAGTPQPGSAGIYPITITADNGITPDASQTFDLTVNLVSQTINFTAPASPITYAPDEMVDLVATGGGSGNPVVFSIDSSSTGTGSISGDTLTITSGGTFVIDANQAGAGNYVPAPQVQQTLVVNPISQTITFSPPTSPILFVPDETVTLSATGGGSGNPVVFSIDPSSSGTGSISGNVLTLTSGGVFVIDANQAGNSSYSAAAQVQQTLVVNLVNVVDRANFQFNPLGEYPESGLIEDSKGDLFGTTEDGGADGDGTVFEVLAGSGVITTLASFDGTNGAFPIGGLVEDKSGDLFGTTSEGGAYGDGTVFEVLSGSGVITTLASFDGTNGSEPLGSLVLDSSGNLFGTTEDGGADGYGTVFEVQAGSGTITTLASFDDANGYGPAGGLVDDSSGNLFGTTFGGGADDDGTVFEVQAGSGAITTLASFDDTNGANPVAGLVDDSSGDLFGTTENGGTDDDGTVFEVQAGSGTITTLASFDYANGYGPAGGLVLDSSGDLFGTTSGGGAHGLGSVFEVQAGSGTITTLASFNGTNGSEPLGTLVARQQRQSLRHHRGWRCSRRGYGVRGAGGQRHHHHARLLERCAHTRPQRQPGRGSERRFLRHHHRRRRLWIRQRLRGASGQRRHHHAGLLQRQRRG